MAGISTPSLAAAVSKAGGLESTGVGATDAVDARPMIEELRGHDSLADNSRELGSERPDLGALVKSCPSKSLQLRQ
ncbi:hypothetical protein [Stakelama tenebrarum]|uniref:Uncharacterized protein n=1 Tax=Stakelama tenebrarum TaxID=2711215 RepID=A0A6G6Y0Z2_9SPHN|nr:hypothetical protein G5C33_01515 [Sphingosinithalassobacter tenebrarum]